MGQASRNRIERVGAIVIIVGTLATLLGFVGAINHSETCYVHLGLGGCVTYYQVALFALLNPVSAILIVLGAIIAVSGITVIVAWSGRQPLTGNESRYSPRLKEVDCVDSVANLLLLLLLSLLDAVEIG